MAQGLSARVGWMLSKALETAGGGAPEEGSATVTRVDSEGTVWVHLPGGVDETPANGSVAVACEPGMAVTYRISGGRLSLMGSTSSPSVGASGVRREIEAAIRTVTADVRRAVDEIGNVREDADGAVKAGTTAKAVADAAKAVANAIGQHFWSDDGGIHVSVQERESYDQSPSGANVLLNAVGQLFRDGTNNLVTITTMAGARAISFWDGLGNAAGNVVASFGDVASIGRAASGHVVVSDDGMEVFDSDASSAARLGTGARIGRAMDFHSEVTSGGFSSMLGGDAAFSVSLATDYSQATLELMTSFDLPPTADGTFLVKSYVSDSLGTAEPASGLSYWAGFDEAPASSGTSLKAGGVAVVALMIDGGSYEPLPPGVTVDMTLGEGETPPWYGWRKVYDSSGNYVTTVRAVYRAGSSWVGPSMVRCANATDSTVTVGLFSVRIPAVASVQIGGDEQSHATIDYHSLVLTDKDGEDYLHVSDLRGIDGTATVTDSFVSTGGITFQTRLPAHGGSADSLLSVRVDGTAVDSSGYVCDVVSSGCLTVRFTSYTTRGTVISLTYATSSVAATAFTFGSRNTGDVGGRSASFGSNNLASGASSFASGMACEATGCSSFVEGYFSKSEGYGSHAEGDHTKASGYASHAEGYKTVADAPYSHAGGEGTVSAGEGSMVFGRYNAASKTDLLEIGNGTSDSARSNALALDQDGNLTLAGGLDLGTALPVSDGGTGATTAAAAWTALGGGAIGKKDSLAVSDIPSLPGSKISGTDVTAVSTVVSSQTGGTVTKAEVVTWGRACQLYLAFQLGSDLSVDAKGNITDTNICVLAGAYWPKRQAAWVDNGDYGLYGVVKDDGTVTVKGARSRGSAYTLTAGATAWSANATYILA